MIIGRKMKITKRQLRKIIKEAIDVVNAETGELLIFDDQSEVDASGGNIKSDAPEAAAMEIMKRLGIIDDAEFETGAFPETGDIPTYSLPNDKWEMLEDEIHGKRHKRKAKKDMERLNIDNLMTRLEDWAVNAGEEYAADNPGVDTQDIAWDLAQGAEYSFEPDEWEMLLYGGPFEGPDDLHTYAADLIA